MMRAELNSPSLAAATSLDFFDLSPTPWRRITLSARDNIWCLVDAVDYAWLSENVWNVWHAGRGGEWQIYAKRNVGRDRATVRMHREILIKADPRPEAFLRTHIGGHLNGQTLDNRRANLRWQTVRQNNSPRNRRPRGEAPSLDGILLQLLTEHGFNQQEIPF